MKTWSFIKEDGTIHPQRYTGPDNLLEMNTPNGCRPIEGVYDRLREKFEDDILVAYVPPKPYSDTLTDWTWNDGTRTWDKVKTEYAIQREVEAGLKSAIESEEKLQLRPLREVVMALVNRTAIPVAALQKLNTIESNIETSRITLQANLNTEV
jgi:hypothetical protein